MARHSFESTSVNLAGNVVAASSGALSGAWGGDADVVFNADVMRRQADELDAELERARFTGQSRDRAVTALVSGQAVLRSGWRPA